MKNDCNGKGNGRRRKGAEFDQFGSARGHGSAVSPEEVFRGEILSLLGRIAKALEKINECAAMREMR